ncbi:hypothetical protein LSAT2_010158 [Lamellibrachia satsuma]|nr:hypothetical protein LSAT2_010158 [Lamellibrachia satsuma]
MSMLLENISKATIDVFEEQTEKWTNQGYSSWQQADADSWADNDSVWLVAPLVARLPSNVQGRVLKLAGQVLETGSNFWSAKNAKDKERHLQKSTALLGHQPFLSLVLTCLQGQDEQREGLLKSLHDELEKFVNNAKEEQERGVSTDERLKSMVEEALLLRLSLVGGLFDTIQKNNGNVQDWTILLIQLVSHSVVDINNNSELFRVVEDMLSVLIHGTLVSDSSEKGEENRKTYTSLTRKLKRELGELQSESIDQIRTLLPLPKQHYMVITSERHTCQTEARGHRAIGFDTIDGKQGLQVTGRQRVSAWDILEGHKNPAPLSLAWFGAIRQERKVLKYEEHFRMLLLHTHSLMKPDSYFLEPPPLPPEELDPVPEKQETKLVEQHTERKQPEATVKRKKTKTRRASRSTSVTSVNTSYINPSNMPQMGFRQDMYGGALPPAQSSWAYRPSQPQHPGYYSQQHLAPGGPRFSPQSAPRQALSSYLRARGQSNQDVYLHGNSGPIPTHQLQQINPAMMQKQQQQQLRQKLRQQQQHQQQAYMNRLSGGTETTAPMYGQQQQPTSMMQGINYPQMAAQGMAPVYRSYQNVPPQSMMESTSNSPMMGSSFNQPYQGPSIGVPTLPPQQGSGYMGQQPPQQTQFSSGARYVSVGAAGLRGSDSGMAGTTSMDVDGISGYSQMVPQTGAAAQGGAGYMSAMQQQQQQRLQQMRQQHQQQQQQQQMLAMQQQQQPTPQQMPQQQRTATMMPQQLQQQMSTSHGQPPQYNSYPQY